MSGLSRGGGPSLASILIAFTCALAPTSAVLFRKDRAVIQQKLSSYADGCLKELWFEQVLDHFRWHNNTKTWKQRYMVCDKHWSTNADETRGPIFFYAGNEGSVELYVNNTGLIWENAEAFGALVIFVEHRYYGRSEPFGPNSWSRDPSYLTVEQALADYARLLWSFTRGTQGASNSPIIAFGGSYGGMLAAWMRIKYPHIITGAVAASAPLGAFFGVPGFNPSKFWEVVTYDASAAAGAAPACAGNVRAAFKALFGLGRSAVGRGQLQELFRLCDALDGEEDVKTLAYWAQGAFDALSMGNYPYPSSYISGDPEAPLPAWPMRAACKHLAGGKLKQPQLLEGLRDAAGVMYNSSGKVACYQLDVSGPAAGNTGPWDYQWCTEMMGQEQPYFPTTGVQDMFWDQGPFDMEKMKSHCRAAWGVEPRAHHCPITYGGVDLRYASNIVLSNGLYDPWSAFGVLSDVSRSVVSVLIPEGAHHVDLMFSHPDDPPSLSLARQKELAYVRMWIDEHKQQVHRQQQQQPQWQPQQHDAP